MVRLLARVQEGIGTLCTNSGSHPRHMAVCQRGDEQLLLGQKLPLFNFSTWHAGPMGGALFEMEKGHRLRSLRRNSPAWSEVHASAVRGRGARDAAAWTQKRDRHPS